MPRRPTASAPSRCARPIASSTISRCATARSFGDCRPGTRSSSPRTRRSCAPTAIPEIRKKLHAEAVEFKLDTPPPGICRSWWDYMEVQTAALPKNKALEGKTVGQIAQDAGQGRHRRLPRPRRRREPRHRVPARRDQCRRSGNGANPDLSERHHRPLGRRRACPVPERLRLQHPAAFANGCARSRSCHWSRRCAG